MSSLEPIFEAVDLHSGKRYRAETVEEFKAAVDQGLGEISLPPDYVFHWNVVQCVKWLVEVGYILPVAGPEWFVRLRKDKMGTASFNGKAQSGDLKVIDQCDQNRVLILLHDPNGSAVSTEFALTLEEARFLRDELNAIPGL